MLFFCNKGAIPEEAYTLMGVNAKVSDEPFGRFGTGLKYAIATILRGGGKLWIKRWGGEGFQLLHFDSQELRVRDQIFHKVRVNGEPLAYTTELGKDWSVEQAYRELVCNCRDENGTIAEAVDDEELADDGWDTIIGVDWKAMSIVHGNNKMFLASPEVCDVRVGSRHISLHKGKSRHVYFRGVAVYQLEHSLPYTLNIHHEITLTEDRTAKSEYEIRSALSVLPYIDNREVLWKILSSEQKFLQSVSYTVPARYPNIWLDTCMSLNQKGKLRNKIAYTWLRKHIRDEKMETGVVISGPSSDLVLSTIRIMRQVGIDISTRMFVIDPDGLTTDFEERELSSGRVIIINEELLTQEKVLETLIKATVFFHTETSPYGAEVDYLVTLVAMLISRLNKQGL